MAIKKQNDQTKGKKQQVKKPKYVEGAVSQRSKSFEDNGKTLTKTMYSGGKDKFTVTEKGKRIKPTTADTLRYNKIIRTEPLPNMDPNKLSKTAGKDTLKTNQGRVYRESPIKTKKK